MRSRLQGGSSRSIDADRMIDQHTMSDLSSVARFSTVIVSLPSQEQSPNDRMIAHECVLFVHCMTS